MNNIETDIESILNLRTNESIGKELADRQLAVITKGYQFLNNPDNNVLYIADEVGLGKTYIAAGIILLFRHFSKNKNLHKDLIIVPKKNLQDKWKKELGNFVSKNYLLDNTKVKESYTFENCIKDKIKAIETEDPVTIFRMTSFSSLVIASNGRRSLQEYFIREVFKNDLYAQNILEKAYDKDYFIASNLRKLRNLIAYLMNALSPKINCLIVDEAHNYKYGPGDETREESIRNEITSRFLGAIKDKQIFEDFPELKKQVKFPLAKKIICLSATPKDRNLYEIKNQISCFTQKHLLNTAKNNIEIEALLKKFLIRGNLEYLLKDDTVSRNQCREEHRKGNVNKSEEADHLTMDDTFESVFWQLIQYKSIKHLNQKNNALFEIGMLAGFETYNVDLDRKKETLNKNENGIEYSEDNTKEYEQTESRKTKDSQDLNIVRNIINSYNETFKQFPPHPKQTKLENEIINQLRYQDKSLIFVRRIASAMELEKRIIEKYEREIVINQQLKKAQKSFNKNKQIIDSVIDLYNTQKIKARLNDLLTVLLLKKEIKSNLLQHNFIDESNYIEQGLAFLEFAYYDKKNSSFKKIIDDFIIKNLRNISSELKSKTILAIGNSFQEFLYQNTEGSEGVDENEHSGYFFLDYFKKNNPGFPYRTKMYRENWFELNPIILNNHFNFIDYDIEDLNSNYLEKITPEARKNQSFKKETETVYDYFSKEGILNKSSTKKSNVINTGELKNTTFLTRFLIEHCDNEFRNWINKRFNTQTEIFLLDLKVLNVILKNIFRNGSGLLAGFLADSQNEEFEEILFNLIITKDAPFHFVLEEIKTIINEFDLIVSSNFDTKDEKRIESVLRNLVPVIGTSGQDKRNRGIIASQFRMPGMPYVLVTTDIFREGEDLHTFCQNIYHYGIAWNPSDMEQRTGRIDRINSLSYRKLNKSQELDFQNKIQVFYPYLKHSVEVNQVVQLFLNLNKFIQTFNTISIDNYYESKIDVNKEIGSNEIPEPIKDRLHSIYDVKEFIT
ncbi:DEAD/DEAH box helicase family protein [uncultured Chryseobacterium sp.]|uniref:DEAD/DEAH box helicase family protein n=1 Tax=uncultured Chryseobacterium sp. TaxID=259322 RepID=UPI0025DA83FD|nr:DEAD/DEAH box helicase family protein [uncultured Chryseobacterium sp.]